MTELGICATPGCGRPTIAHHIHCSYCEERAARRLLAQPLSPFEKHAPAVMVLVHGERCALAADLTPSRERVRIGVLLMGRETSVVATPEEARAFHAALGALLEKAGGS